MAQSLTEGYIASHSTAPSGLEWIVRQTHIRTNYPQMLSGPVEGQLLGMLVKISGARRVLEIGTFTGYSAACMALSLPEGGHLDALEINDELEDLILEGWERAGVSSMISLHIGDALETISRLDGPYDLVFIDANKREYPDYYRMVLPLLPSGGLIVADDVMLGGKVLGESPATDPQTSGLISFNDMVSSDPAVELVMLPLRDGLSIIRKK